MRTRRRNTGRCAALGGLALTSTLAAGCGLPGRAPEGPAPEDVVSVGYGTQSRNDVAVSVSSVTAERVGRGSITRVEDLLERIPGLEVLRYGRGEFTVRIRGMGFGVGNTEPLLVIDEATVPAGAISSALASIPPRDIVRIDVLKAVASTVVYGTRGANGVIIVTTRRRR